MTEDEYRVEIAKYEYAAGYYSGQMHLVFGYVPLIDKGRGADWIRGFNDGYASKEWATA